MGELIEDGDAGVGVGDEVEGALGVEAAVSYALVEEVADGGEVSVPRRCVDEIVVVSSGGFVRFSVLGVEETIGVAEKRWRIRVSMSECAKDWHGRLGLGFRKLETKDEGLLSNFDPSYSKRLGDWAVGLGPFSSKWAPGLGPFNI